MKRFFMLGTCLVALTGLALTGCAKQQKKTTTGMKRIHFDFDKSDIKASAEPALRNNAKWLQENSSKKDG